MNSSYPDLFHASNFVPLELDSFLGLVGEDDRPKAKIKVSPSDFIVEEVTNDGLQTTVSTKSDLDPTKTYPGPGGYVGVTLVKRQWTTVDGVIAAAELLGVPREDVSYAGQKDRWSESSQCVRFKNVDIEHVRRHCCPETLTRAGFFLKDPVHASEPLHRGRLVGNRFRIRVTIPNMSAAQIEAYLARPLDMLARENYHFPNFYGRQRLGQRQNLVPIGHALITQGAEAAIKLFLTQTSANENQATTAVRNLLALDWKNAEIKAAENGKSVAEQWPYWHGMQMELAKHRTLNLAVEKAIVDKTLELCDFEKVIPVIDKELKSGPSLWIGAYQSFWFNQALAKHMRKEIRLPNNFIPLYMLDEAVEKWYRRFGMPMAIPESVDQFVARKFLTPRPPRQPRGNYNVNTNTGNRANNHRRPPARVFEFAGPCRNAFIPLQALTYQAEDGVLNISFMLRSGGYATTFLGMLFNLDQDDRVLSDERIRY